MIKEAMLYVLISGFSLTVTTFASTVELIDMGFRINGTVLIARSYREQIQALQYI